MSVDLSSSFSFNYMNSDLSHFWFLSLNFVDKLYDGALKIEESLNIRIVYPMVEGYQEMRETSLSLQLIGDLHAICLISSSLSIVVLDNGGSDFHAT